MWTLWRLGLENFAIVTGWEPLCEFLGVKVPPEPLPHAGALWRASSEARSAR